MTRLQQTALTTQALDLPPFERAQLALLLIDSVEEPGADVWPKSLVEELRKRSAELQSGKVRGLSSEEVFGEPL